MAVTIFKYTRRAHLDRFFTFGEIRIGTLLDFRNVEEHGHVIGDRDEGQYITILSNPEPRIFSLNDNSPEANFFKRFLKVNIDVPIEIEMEGNSGIRLSSNSTNCYTYCASSKFDPLLLQRYGSSCIEIFDAGNFFNEISKILKWKRQTTFAGFQEVVYENRVTDHTNPHKIHPAWIKDEEWKIDCEVRAVWNPKVEIKESFVMIYAPKAVEFCRIHTY